MGDPVGIGPEIILLALEKASVYDICRPVVFGDLKILQKAKQTIGSALNLETVKEPESGRCTNGIVDVLPVSRLDPDRTVWGSPTVETGSAMVEYIIAAVDMAVCGRIGAVVTCPINKKAMQMAGFNYNGHTELIAERTGSGEVAMMLAGSRLRVVLVTIHTALREVPSAISTEKILRTIRITGRSLNERFGIEHPRIAVAALNPHAGEEGMFGSEEKTIIGPAIELARAEGIDASGPYPPDTIFYRATAAAKTAPGKAPETKAEIKPETRSGRFDAVVCMYHDQGLIPFKLIHFADGVNTTLGLPIIRTSVDHGTAYDIAGSGAADPGSLTAAIKMAAEQQRWRIQRTL